MRLLFLAVLVTICAAASAGGFREVAVKVFRGAPQLVVDGRPVVPLSFMGWYGAKAKRVHVDEHWQRFYVTFTAPEDCHGQAGFQIRILTGGPGKLWIDDLRYYEGTPEKPIGPNMQPHGDFEDTGDELPRSWGLFFRKDKGADAAWAYDTTTAASGKRSLRIDIKRVVPGGWLHIYLSGSSVRLGHTYTVELSMKADPPRQIELAALHQGPPWTSYMSGQDCVYIQQVKLAAAAGIHIHQFGYGLPWSKTNGPLNFAAFDKAMLDTIKADPDAMVMVRIFVEPPGWWLEQHPDERTTYEDGTKTQVSTCSQLWLDEMLPKLEAFIRHCEEKWGDRLLVYFPSGQHTGEWFYPGVWTRHFPGFSPALTRAFRQWLKNKYGSPDKLSAAWGREIGSFDDVAVPTVEERTAGRLGEFFDPARDRYQVDFFDFMNDAMADTVSHIATTIKRASGKPVMFFFGYLYSLAPTPAGLNHSGHLRIDQMLDNPDIDIFCSPIDYFDRQPGGAGHFMTTAESIAAHGKMWFNEDDTRTYLTPEAAGYGRCPTPRETYGVHQRNFAQIFPRRMGCWYMDLGNAGWLNSRDIWENIGRLRDLWLHHLTDPVTFAPQVAVITDSRSPLYVRSRSPINAALISHLRAQIARMGAPAGYWLLSDLLAGRVKPARLYIFQNAFVLTAAQRRRVREILADQGATAVWFYAPGFIDPDAAEASEQFIRELTGIPVTRLPEPTEDLAEPVAENPLCQGVSGPFGPHQKTLRLQFAVQPAQDIEPIARYPSGQLAVATADQGRWRSVYFATLFAPARLLRNIARAAGVWIYCETNDVVVADEHFLAIAASSDGAKTVRLPRECTVRDALTGEVVGRGREVTVEMRKGDTRLLWME